MKLVVISRRLSEAVDRMTFGAPIDVVYNPLAYARRSHEAYLQRYGVGPKEVVFLGMNPGPYGMAQTGIPFGDVTMVRNWLGIDEAVESPPVEHPKRPIQGLSCPRSEVSGSRLWGWARDRFETPQRFFARFFVVNYCPLVFMEESGRNFTPDKLRAAERDPLLAACDEALRQVVDELQPGLVVGVGAFAQRQAERALQGFPGRIGGILHPSPASPRANRGWSTEAERQLAELGVRW